MIKIPTFPELQFEERNHTYTLNGIQIPSVTTVMRTLSESYYGTVDRDVLDTAAKRGTAVHQAIENYLMFGIDDIPPEHEGYYEAFKSWWAEKKPKLVGAEGRVYHRVLRYAGTADLSCLMKDSKGVELLYCIDYKTSAQIVEMLVRVQLEAYFRAYDSHGFYYDNKAVVHLRKDGKWDMIQIRPSDTEAWEVFGSMLTVRNYLEKYGR